jgi:tetratricopeptide (TPR) repeat protein
VPIEYPIELPEPWASALREQRYQDVARANAQKPDERYARGSARLSIGHTNEARDDFASATSGLGDVALVECLYIDRRRARTDEDYQRVRRELQELVGRRPHVDFARARALHELGWIHGKFREQERCIDALLEARGIYAALGMTVRSAHTRDTLGTFYGSIGRLNSALLEYSMCLATKAAEGDQRGVALTLGNLARTYIRLGRTLDARECAEQNLRISQALQDEGSVVQAIAELGRIALYDDLDEAERRLQEALNSALHAKGNTFYIRKDLAMLATKRRDLETARTELEAARKERPPEPFTQLLLEDVEARIALAQSDPGSLERTARNFVGQKFFADAIPLLLDLSRAYGDGDEPSLARRSLYAALALARREGCDVFLPRIREELSRFDLQAGGGIDFGDDSIEAPGDEPFLPLVRIGQGTFGEVYQALDDRRDEVVAVKRFPLAIEASDTPARERLLASARTELRATEGLRHAGVASVRAVRFDRGGNLLLVQDFISGRSLRAAIDDGPITHDRVLFYAVEIGRTLAALYEKGIVHRDLKPENIILKKADGAPVLIDFGVAHIRAESRRNGGFGFAGTITYLPPNQRREQRPDTQSDLFALGVVLGECVLGRLPEDLSSEDPERALAGADELRAELGSSAGLPERLKEVCIKLLWPDRNDRPTARDIIRQLG